MQIKQSKLKEIIIESIKKVMNENKLNELDTNTYANLMNKTTGYEMALNSSDKSTQIRWEKSGKINSLSRERFEEQFYKEFPIGEVKINTNNGVYVFNTIKFTTNMAKYELQFLEKGKKNGDIIWVSRNRGVGNNFDIVGQIGVNRYKVIDQNSEELLNKMLRYSR